MKMQQVGARYFIVCSTILCVILLVGCPGEDDDPEKWVPFDAGIEEEWDTADEEDAVEEDIHTGVVGEEAAEEPPVVVVDAGAEPVIELEDGELVPAAEEADTPEQSEEVVP